MATPARPKKTKPEHAPAFAPIRNNPKFESVYANRSEHAAKARKAQTRYRLMLRLFLIATTFTAILGALSLYGDPASTPGAELIGSTFKTFFSRSDVRLGLHLFQIAAVAVAIFCANDLSTSDHLTLWREHREKAELGRLDRGRMALEIGYAKGPDAFKAGAEFLVADLVTGQICYLTQAIDQKERQARGQTLLTAGILALAGVAPLMMLAGFSGLVLFGALVAVVAPALIASFRSWAEATGSADRVKLHRATRSMLRDVHAHRDELDAAVAAHDLGAATAYAEKVFAALRTDVEGFLKITGAAPTPPAPTPPAPKPD